MRKTTMVKWIVATTLCWFITNNLFRAIEINVALILFVYPAILVGLLVVVIVDVVKWRMEQETLPVLFQHLSLQMFWTIFVFISALSGMRCPLAASLYWIILGPYVSTKKWWMPVSSLILFGVIAFVEKIILPESYFVCLPIEGFLLGAVQWCLLRREFRRAWLWVCGMTVGWGVGGYIVLIALRYFEDFSSGEVSLLLKVEPGAIGGLLAGIMTGSLLWWLFKNHRLNTLTFNHESKIEDSVVLTVD